MPTTRPPPLYQARYDKEMRRKKKDEKKKLLEQLQVIIMRSACFISFLPSLWPYLSCFFCLFFIMVSENLLQRMQQKIYK